MSNSDKKTPAFLARLKETTAMIILSSILVSVAAGMTFFNESVSLYQSTKGLIKDWLPSSIDGKFLVSGGIESGKVMTFSYTLPDSGYYSLWNQNSEGVMIRLLPNDQINPSEKIHKKEKTYQFKVSANKAKALEHIVILWSNNANHPPQPRYQKWRNFKEYMEIHPYEWDIKKVAVQIL